MKMDNPARRTNGLVPDGARLAASGKAGIAHFTEGGVTIFVVDETTKSLIFSGRVPANEQVVIRIDGDAKTVVAQTTQSEDDKDAGFVLAKPIEKDHRFSIWTLGGPPPGQGVMPTTSRTSIEIVE